MGPTRQPPHGRRSSYTRRCCRCASCRREQRRYQQRYRRNGGVSDGLVPAAPVFEHLSHLEVAGVGLRRVRQLTGVSRSSLQRIRNGAAARVTRRVADAVLAVPLDAQAPGALVPASQVAREVRAARDDGVSASALARESGRGADRPSLPTSGKARARTRDRVRHARARLHERSGDGVAAQPH